MRTSAPANVEFPDTTPSAAIAEHSTVEGVSNEVNVMGVSIAACRDTAAGLRAREAVGVAVTVSLTTVLSVWASADPINAAAVSALPATGEPFWYSSL